jgi:hypothetical protein
VKNKAFFFVDYEGTEQRADGPANASVAPAAWRTGDLSSIPQTVRDPLTATPFANNRIPANRITNPVAQALFSNTALYPLANQAGVGPLGITNNFASGTASPIRTAFPAATRWAPMNPSPAARFCPPP